MEGLRYDKNGAVLVGELKKVNERFIYVEADKNTFPILMTNTVKSVEDKLKKSLETSSNLYTVVYGHLTSGEKTDYIYPVGISFSSLAQPHKRFVTLSGTILGVYEYETRKRILLSVERKKTVKLFITIFNSRGISVNKNMVGKKIMVDGLLEIYQDRFSVLADYVFVQLNNNEQFDKFSSGNIDNVEELEGDFLL